MRPNFTKRKKKKEEEGAAPRVLDHRTTGKRSLSSHSHLAPRIERMSTEEVEQSPEAPPANGKVATPLTEEEKKAAAEARRKQAGMSASMSILERVSQIFRNIIVLTFDFSCNRVDLKRRRSGRGGNLKPK